MRVALLIPGSLIVSSIAMYACSSSDPATTPADGGAKPTTSSASSTSGEQTSSSSGEDQTSSSSGGDNTSSSSGSGGDKDGGTSSSSSTGGMTSSSSSSSGAPVDGGAAGTLCTTGATPEVEPPANDTAATAQVIPATTGTAKMSFCGRLSSATDVDFITYTFNTTAAFGLSGGQGTSDATAGQKIEITVDGQTQEFKGNLSIIKPGKPILFKVTGTKAVDYRFNLDVTQN